MDAITFRIRHSVFSEVLALAAMADNADACSLCVAMDRAQNATLNADATATRIPLPLYDYTARTFIRFADDVRVSDAGVMFEVRYTRDKIARAFGLPHDHNVQAIDRAFPDDVPIVADYGWEDHARAVYSAPLAVETDAGWHADDIRNAPQNGTGDTRTVHILTVRDHALQSTTDGTDNTAQTVRALQRASRYLRAIVTAAQRADADTMDALACIDGAERINARADYTRDDDARGMADILSYVARTMARATRNAAQTERMTRDARNVVSDALTDARGTVERMITAR
jgi:hypothetical protein